MSEHTVVLSMKFLSIRIYLRASERSERSEHIVVVSSRFYYIYINTMAECRYGRKCIAVK